MTKKNLTNRIYTKGGMLLLTGLTALTIGGCSGKTNSVLGQKNAATITYGTNAVTGSLPSLQLGAADKYLETGKLTGLNDREQAVVLGNKTTGGRTSGYVRTVEGIIGSGTGAEFVEEALKDDAEEHYHDNRSYTTNIENHYHTETPGESGPGPDITDPNNPHPVN